VRAAEAPVTTYYAGEAITTTGADVSRKPYIVARTIDKAKSTISESVVSFSRGAFRENASVIKVDGNRLTMSESTGTVTGSGELTGVPWNWTFLHAEFSIASFGLRIVDFNFFAEPGSILGHKDFYRKDDAGEKLWMQEDVVLHAVDEPTFAAKRRELLKP
jgi:hypothetical protein